LRTAAVVAIAAKHMAREDSRRLGLFGVGRNAFGILKALLTVRSIKEIFVSSRDPERRQKFCDEAAQMLGIIVRGVDNPEQAVRGMDVVLTATNSLSPIFPESWVDPGTHVSSMKHGVGPRLLSRRSNCRRKPGANKLRDSAALPLVELTARQAFWAGFPVRAVTGRCWRADHEINIFRVAGLWRHDSRSLATRKRCVGTGKTDGTLKVQGSRLSVQS
jgi:hypothetical protein